MLSSMSLVTAFPLNDTWALLGRRCAKYPMMASLLEMAKLNEGIVIDVGANGGCEMFHALRNGRRVIGVECLGSAYHELLSMSAIGEHPNATLLHVCASNSTRIADLNLARDSSSLIEANVRKTRSELRKVPTVGRVREPVVLVPLDEVLSPAEHVAVIKVDVQGTEYEVLQGLRRTIVRDRPLISYEDDAKFLNSSDLGRMLRELGYSCRELGHYDKVCTHASASYGSWSP